jgi:hypothetical protein
MQHDDPLINTAPNSDTWACRLTAIATIIATIIIIYAVTAGNQESHTRLTLTL